ncbi:hypothetical protein NSMS1_50420 [Nostoc sp. MS1]|nr:hypothetical protein NSMS1_50420 [Nostoc sp. MS1]
MTANGIKALKPKPAANTKADGWLRVVFHLVDMDFFASAIDLSLDTILGVMGCVSLSS